MPGRPRPRYEEARDQREARRAGARGGGGGWVGAWVCGVGGRGKRRSEWRCHLEAKL